MLLKSISDIGNDAMTAELECLAFKYGVMDMLHVYLLVEEFIGRDGERVSITTDDVSLYEISRAVIAMAIVNHACIFHENFELPMLETGMTVRFKRNRSINEHRDSRRSLLKKLEELAKANLE